MRENLFISAIDLMEHPIPKWEYHIHTNYTDGQNTVEEMVLSAIKKGITRMIFTEHTEPWQAKQEGWFPKYVKDIKSCKRKFESDIELIIGIEAPAIDFNGNLEATEEMFASSEFILGAAHRYPGLGNRRVRDLNPKEALELEYKTLMALASSEKVDAIAHIGATCMKYCGPFPSDLTRDVVREATKHGKAIEINQAYHKPLDDFIRICQEENALIIPGSNAHKADSIGSVYDALNTWKNERS